ncbi:Trp biosynthesis-associated membrane protein [Cellulomonas dongxiuzhuiae]|uniref:Trp biosynthesis-associated membrane protein n=1 Tax=Cellulomonas dongxiuzhuiae TaxID=2819979 RepID=UPI001AAFFC4F|nr:Trp biosynthesis-associated membrane protein [Cellulomonas dongxiuzhuiae]MBO3087041.1 Trp biosynthesis-associated membrane protein [Cellulomonas dongxiuzhuiae]
MTGASTAGSRAAVTDGPARRGRWVLLLLLAAALVGLVALPTWVVAEGSSALEDQVRVAVAGSQVAPQASAAALVLLAAAGAAALVGRAGRWVVAIVVAGAGVLVVAAGVAVLADPSGAVTGAVAQATGVAAGDARTTTTPAPVAAVVVGVLVVLLAAALARARGAWRQGSRRHERPGATGSGPAPAGPADERSDWDALSRGDDPS